METSDEPYRSEHISTKKNTDGLAWYPRTPRPQHAPRELIMKWTTYLSKQKGLEPTSLTHHPPCSVARAGPQTGLPSCRTDSNWMP